MLTRVIHRLQWAEMLNEIIIATSIGPADDPIASLCKNKEWNCFRGSQDDVLDRYYHAAQAFQADIIIRITADCPLIEPRIVDEVLGAFRSQQSTIDYASNMFPKRTYPRGLDTEAFTFKALEKAWREDRDPALREHVTQYILRNPQEFRMAGITSPRDLSFMRWTVDTWQDLELVRKIYKHFISEDFSWLEVVSFLELHPELLEINRHINQKPVP